MNWKKISRLYPAKIKESGNSAWQVEDIQKMLESTVQLKNKAIIHFLASTGVRVGSMADLKLRHLRDMPDDCKMVLIYEGSKEEYPTFLTPKASKALDNYLSERKQAGEVLHDDSILFRANYTLISQKPRPMTTKAIQSVITRAIKNAAIRGQKKNGRYTTQGVHGFRKRFNTVLKLNNSVNDNAIEKMMGHKHGLDGSYFQGTIEQLFEEFRKGIPELTVDGTARKQAELEQVKQEKSELENKIPNMVKDAVERIKDDLLREGWSPTN